MRDERALKKTKGRAGAQEQRTVDPGDGDCLEEDGEQHRVSGRVPVEQVEKVEAALSARGQPHEEVEGEETRHEALPVSADDGKLVAQGCDDSLRTTKLATKFKPKFYFNSQHNKFF